ncbi:uncharacterized protein RCH25_008027 [Pelodytes ibericus]
MAMFSDPMMSCPAMTSRGELAIVLPFVDESAETLRKPILKLITDDLEDIILIGDNISFVCTTELPNPKSFKFYHNQSFVKEQAEATVKLSEVQSNLSGVYTCVYCSDTDCSLHSDPENVYVKDTFPRPVITVNSKLVSQPGSDVIISCEASYQDVIFVFYKGSTLVKEDTVGNNYSSYIIQHIGEKDTGQYMCMYKTKPNSKYPLESVKSNPLMIRVKDLPMPSTSYGIDPTDSGRLRIRCTAPNKHIGRMWFQLLNATRHIEMETEEQNNYAEFTVDRPEHSWKEYYCIYSIRMGTALADSLISYPIVIGDVVDFTKGNIIRLLLSAMILGLIGFSIWKHFTDYKKTKELPPRLPNPRDNIYRYTKEP